MSTKKFLDLYEFIDRAVRSRKYPESTAQGLRAALKLFEAELNEDETASLDVFRQNIEQIYQSVATNNGKQYSAGSLATYKSRIVKVLGDYEKYGIDPTKMASWSPKLITRSPKKQEEKVSSGESSDPQDDVPSVSAQVGMHKIELALRPDKKFVIIIPRDITVDEAKIVKSVLDSLTKE
ncbi:MAG: hypothetical protein WC763_01845 [Candidatus Paceibacterota bacterium]|jgi:hypothetical protein